MPDLYAMTPQAWSEMVYGMTSLCKIVQTRQMPWDTPACDDASRKWPRLKDKIHATSMLGSRDDNFRVERPLANVNRQTGEFDACRQVLCGLTLLEFGRIF